MDKPFRLCYDASMREPGERIKYTLIAEVDDVRCFKSWYYTIDQLEEEGLRKAEAAVETILNDEWLVTEGDDD